MALQFRNEKYSNQIRFRQNIFPNQYSTEKNVIRKNLFQTYKLIQKNNCRQNIAVPMSERKMSQPNMLRTKEELYFCWELCFRILYTFRTNFFTLCWNIFRAETYQLGSHDVGKYLVGTVFTRKKTSLGNISSEANFIEKRYDRNNNFRILEFYIF